MAWTGKFTRNSAKGVGITVAEFTDDKGKLIARVEKQMNIEDGAQHGPFIEDAQAILTKAQEAVAVEDAQEATMQLLIDKLNG